MVWCPSLIGLFRLAVCQAAFPGYKYSLNNPLPVICLTGPAESGSFRNRRPYVPLHDEFLPDGCLRRQAKVFIATCSPAVVCPGVVPPDS